MVASTRHQKTPNGGRLVSAESLQRRLDTGRRPSAFGNSQPKPEDRDSLKRTFSELARRSLELFADPRLKLPETSRLFQTAGEVLALTRLVHRELERFSTPHAILVDPQVVAEGLRGMRCHLNGLAAQLKLLDEVDVLAVVFDPLLDSLHRSPTTSSQQLWEIVRRITQNAGHDVQAAPITPVSEFSLAAYLERLYKPAHSHVMAAGIETARLVAWLTAEAPEWQSRRELLTAAALLVDCGFATLCGWRNISPAQLEHVDAAMHRRHPAVGAALAAGLTGAPTDLPRIIGMHHQRLAGGDSPGEFDTHRFSPAARFLAIAVRLRELQHDEAKSGQPHAAMDGTMPEVPSILAAAVCLKQEADGGAWDDTIVKRLLARIGSVIDLDDAPQISGDASSQQTMPASDLVGQSSADHLRHDEPHPLPAAAGTGQPLHQHRAIHAESLAPQPAPNASLGGT